MLDLGVGKKKMKIGIVLNPYDEEKQAGLGRAVFEITKHLLLQDKKNEYLLIVRKAPKNPDIFPGSNWKIKVSDHSYFWLDKAIWGENLDICIFNTPVIPFFIKPKKTVVIAHDFAYLDFNPNFLLKVLHRYSLRKSDKIISVSDATSKEVVKRFIIPENKIKTIHLGYTHICELEIKPVQVPENYFLFVGSIKERKNVLGIIKAFHLSKGYSGFSAKLFICGNGVGKYYEKLKKYISENDLIDDIFFSGHVSDQELSFIYKKAKCLLYPSFIEGFGFPILEAMSCGVPVITSNASSLVEVAGEAALIVDPKDPKAIAQAMVRLNGDNDLRQKLIERGRTQARKFDWNKTAQEICDYILN